MSLVLSLVFMCDVNANRNASASDFFGTQTLLKFALALAFTLAMFPREASANTSACEVQESGKKVPIPLHSLCWYLRLRE